MMQEGTQASDEPGNRGSPEGVGLLDGRAAHLTTDVRLSRARPCGGCEAGYLSRTRPGRDVRTQHLGIIA